MKKIFYILASAIVALGAVACDNQDLDNIAPGVGGDSLSFSAVIDNTKTDLNGLETVWVKDDVVVFEGYEQYEFVYDGSANFTCTVEGVTAALGDKDGLTAWYNKAGIDSTKDTAGAQLKAEGCSFTALNPKFAFAVQNAFLKFTTTAETVTLKGAGMFSTGDEVTIEGTGETQYVAINPANTTLSYSVNDIECKKVALEFAAKNIYNLGELGLTASGYNVVGSFQGWAPEAGKAVVMYNTTDGWAVAKGIELYKSDEFKIVKGNTWTTSYGFASAGVLKVDTETAVQTSNSQNMKAAKNGKFDIYFNGSNKVKYVCAEEYTGTVNITIDNKAGWNPVYITLKSGSTTIVNNATVSNNTYAISMNYIGESLSYTLSNGTKELSGNVSITKDGATINLEETVIKLKVQLNTDNAKQWWGNTMKIHAWDTGTSFDTSWPGNNMTSEGNYTWSITVPSELVGKTVKYLVHNGNGWQSDDATVTINAEGNTVTGSSIGIN